jgi:hypothetical protein
MRLYWARRLGATDRERRPDTVYLSPKTVRNYVSSIFTKPEVSARVQAIVQAREAGLGTKGDPS